MTAFAVPYELLNRRAVIAEAANDLTEDSLFRQWHPSDANDGRRADEDLIVFFGCVCERFDALCYCVEWGDQDLFIEVSSYRYHWDNLEPDPPKFVEDQIARLLAFNGDIHCAHEVERYVQDNFFLDHPATVDHED